MKKSVKIILIILALIFLGIAAFAGYKVYTIMKQYYTDQAIYSELGDEYVQKVDTTKPFKHEDSSAAPSDEDGEEEEFVLDEISPIKVDFDSLQKDMNSDIVGWIYCPDTKPEINYPITYRAGDDYYYLNHNARNESTPCGSIFIGSLNFPNFKDKNTIIHGHHLNDGSMFGNLGKWQDQEWFDSHKYFYLNTPSRNYKAEAVAYAVVAYDSDAYKIDFTGDEQAEWFKWVKEQSRVESDYEFHAGDRFITLSTCMYEFANARGVLICKLTPMAG